MQISELNVKKEIIQGLLDMGFDKLTPIQEEVIMPIIEGKDVIGQAHTGTGKTAAFTIPILNNLDIDLKKPQVLILCPTRELAVQVKKEVKTISAHMDVRSTSIYGGSSIMDQIKKIRKGSQILVGTPGRVIDLIKRNVIKFDDIKTVIIDEADEMLKMGFREDIELILSYANKDIQTLLFSATIPKTVLLLKDKYQKNPIFFKTVSKEMTSDTISQSYYIVKHSNKIDALTRILDIYTPKLALVFCNTKRKVDEVTDEMIAKGYNCDKIHGDIKQSTRLDVLNKFNNGVITILVATDVAARGLDIKEVEAVINYDVPDKEDYYVHRIGRTGRAGNQGASFTLTSLKELDRIKSIERFTKKEIRKRSVPSAERVLEVKKEKIVKDILDTIDNVDVSDMRLIAEMLFATDKDPKDIVTALLQINYSFKKSTDTSDLNEIVPVRLKSTPRSSNKYDRFDRNDKSGKNFKSDKSYSSDKSDFDRYYINAGKKDNVQPRDILGAVAGECNISGDDIYKIDVYETFSFFNVASSERKKVLDNMKDVMLKGRNVKAELTRKRK